MGRNQQRERYENMQLKNFLGFNKPVTQFLNGNTVVRITTGDYVDVEKRQVEFFGHLDDIPSHLLDLTLDPNGARIKDGIIEIFCHR